MGAAFAEGEAVITRLRYEDPETRERVPAGGARVIVSTEDGTVVGEGVTNADGEFELAVAGPGTYLLELDVSTLPDGVTLREGAPNPATVKIEEGQQTGRAIFGLTTGLEETISADAITFRRVAQLIVEGIKLGLFLGLAAIGLSLIFGTTGLVNFAHGEIIVFGMLMAYMFNFYGLQAVFGFMEGWPAPLGGGMNVIPATILAIIVGGFVGYSLDRWLFNPLRRRGASLIAQMVVTIGLGIVARYVFLFAFRGVPRFFKDYTAQTAIDAIPLIDITPKDLIAAILAVVILLGVGFYLLYTRMGKAMRAVSDNRDLAESSGIDVQRVIRFVWVAGGSLGAVGGIFIGLSEQVSWNIGFRILLLIFAGTILGGLGTAFGALVGSLVVGVGIQLSTLVIATELKNVGALVILIFALVIRPQGILGKKERVG